MPLSALRSTATTAERALRPSRACKGAVVGSNDYVSLLIILPASYVI